MNDQAEQPWSREPTAYPCVTIGSDGDVRTGPVFQEFKGCDCRLIPWRDWKATVHRARAAADLLEALERIEMLEAGLVAAPDGVPVGRACREIARAAIAKAAGGAS